MKINQRLLSLAVFFTAEIAVSQTVTPISPHPGPPESLGSPAYATAFQLGGLTFYYHSLEDPGVDLSTGRPDYGFGQGWNLDGNEFLTVGAAGLKLRAGSGSTQLFVERTPGRFTAKRYPLDRSSFERVGETFEQSFPDLTTRTFTRIDGSTYALSERRDQFGNRTRITREGGSNGRIRSVEDPFQGVWRFEYSSEQVKITDPDGGVARLMLDSRKNLVLALANTFDSHTFAYDDRHLMTAHRVNDLPALILRYYPEGALQSVTNRKGETATYTYSTDGVTVSAPGLRGDFVVRFSRGEIIAAEYDGWSRRYVRDELGRIVEQRDSQTGEKSRFTYPPIEGSFPAYAPPIAASTPEGDSSYRYDTDFNLIEVKAGGRTSSYRYESFGGQKLLTEFTNPRGLVVKYRRDPQSGAPLAQTLGSVVLVDTTRNSLGQITAWTDLYGVKTTFEYDTRGRLKTQRNSSGEVTYTRAVTNGAAAPFTPPAIPPELGGNSLPQFEVVPPVVLDTIDRTILGGVAGKWVTSTSVRTAITPGTIVSDASIPVDSRAPISVTSRLTLSGENAQSTTSSGTWQRDCSHTPAGSTCSTTEGER